MSKILKLIVIVLLAAVLVIGIWWWLKKGGADNQPAGGNIVATSTPQVGLEDIGNVKIDDSDRALTQTSLGWAERFATYSNHDNYQNFEELNAVMTENMRGQVKILTDKLRREHRPDDAYWGITSQALTANIQSGSAAEGQIKISVKLQRHEVGQNLDKDYQQDLIFDIVKNGADWQINDAQLKNL